ncbi:MAG: phosphoribosyltransferase family protein, partial [Pseudomonadota bacterium]|nr:phosphoribosyltransferase family protein [Pseudomonadota bacterium]
SLLIVDDVHDTGLTIQAVVEQLKIKTRRNTPHEIRIATPWFKPGKNRTNNVPDYCIHQTDEWLVFPHELDGLLEEEIKQKGAVYGIMRGIDVPDNPLR